MTVKITKNVKFQEFVQPQKSMSVRHTIVAALAITGLMIGGVSFAAEGGDTSQAHHEHMGKMGHGARHGKFLDKKLDKLHTDLQLTSAQEPAWKNWSDPLRQQAAEMMSKMGNRRAEHEEMMKMPAPDRMEKMLNRMKEHQQQMEAQLPAMRTFYGQLSAEQKKVFDACHLFGGRHGERQQMREGRSGQKKGPETKPEA